MSETDDATVFARVCDVVVEVFKTDHTSLSPETTRRDIEAWDSLGHVMLMMRLEKTFGIRFSSADIGQPQTVAQLCELVETTRRSV